MWDVIVNSRISSERSGKIQCWFLLVTYGAFLPRGNVQVTPSLDWTVLPKWLYKYLFHWFIVHYSFANWYDRSVYMTLMYLYHIVCMFHQRQDCEYKHDWYVSVEMNDEMVLRVSHCYGATTFCTIGRGRLGKVIFFFIIETISNDFCSLEAGCSLSTWIESLTTCNIARGLGRLVSFPSRRLCPICRVGRS